MKSWKEKLGLYKYNDEKTHATHLVFNPAYAFKPKDSHSPVHYLTSLSHAQTIIRWMMEEDIGVIWVDLESKDLKKKIKQTLRDNLLDKVPFPTDETMRPLILKEAHTHFDTLKKLSKEGSIYLFSPLHTLAFSFNAVVDEDIPPRSNDIYILSRLFFIPYEDWFLATILDQLEEHEEAWIKAHLDSPFVRSLSVKTVIMSSSMRKMVMYVEDFVNVIKQLFNNHFMDELKGFSFGFVYHFMFKE